MNNFLKWLLAIFIAVGIITFYGFVKWTDYATGKTADAGMAECPHSWIGAKVVNKQRTVVEVTMPLTVPGPTTDVPEFHDCQKLIFRNGTYGDLTAVFASFQMDSLIDSLFKLDTAGIYAAGSLTTSAVAIAEVLDLGTLGYQPLGIEMGFNCVQLFMKAHKLAAQMHPVVNEAECALPYVPTAALKTLEVRQVAPPGFKPGDIPPVARWDTDSARSLNYIGFKCGPWWCEVGDPGFGSSLADMNGAGGGDFKMRRIKGWYDEQYLAVPTGAGPTASLSMSGIKATVIPDPWLKSRTLTDFTGKWPAASYIALDASMKKYKDKLNLDLVVPGGDTTKMSRLEMCYGRRGQCGVPWGVLPKKTCGPMNWAYSLFFPRWWARVRSAADNTVVYRCVIQRSHEGLTLGVPGTSRWRWSELDETVWQECLAGCCEVETGIW